MIEIRVKCDAAECAAAAVVQDDDEQPVCFAGWEERGGHFVVDTSWIDLPAGWTFVGETSAMRCPEHRVIEGSVGT